MWLYRVLSFLFSLNNCISVRTIGVQIQRMFWILRCDCQRWCVFLKGSRSSLWCVCVVIKVFWFLSGILKGFLGTGCSTWLRVNQYKFTVWIFLSLISLNQFLLEFYNCCYKQPIVSQKQPVDFLLLSENYFFNSAEQISNWLILFGLHYTFNIWEQIYKQFPPPPLV